MLAAEYPFLNVLWSMLVFFGLVLWIWLLVRVFGDVFRRHDISGWGKLAWSVFVILVPLVGAFCYLIAQGGEMGKRDVQAARARKAEFDAYVREAAGNGGGAGSEIAQAKELLDGGAITEAEFEHIKQRALA